MAPNSEEGRFGHFPFGDDYVEKVSKQELLESSNFSVNNRKYHTRFNY